MIINFGTKHCDFEIEPDFDIEIEEEKIKEDFEKWIL